MYISTLNVYTGIVYVCTPVLEHPCPSRDRWVALSRCNVLYVFTHIYFGSKIVGTRIIRTNNRRTNTIRLYCENIRNYI